MDDPNIAHWPSDLVPAHDPLLMKWNHSVLQLEDFMPEWAAIDKAFHLAWEVTGSFVPTCSSVEEHAPVMNEVSHYPSALMLNPCTSHKTVCFDPIVTGIVFHPAQIQSFAMLTVPGVTMPSAKSWTSPLTWSKWTPAMAMTADCFCFCFPSTGQDMQSEMEHPEQFSQQASCPTKDQKYPHSSASGSLYMHPTTRSEISCPTWLTDVSNDPAFTCRQYCEVSPWLYARSRQACSHMMPHSPQHPMPPGQDHTTLQPRMTTLPCCRLRRDFESPLADLPQDNSDEEDDRVNLPLHNPNAPADALFVRDLVLGLREAGADEVHDDFNVPIRSWFLDHATIRQWFAPRVFQLQGPPNAWEDQIVAVWRDQLDDNEWFDVSVIRPQPPRPPRHQAVVLDIVIAQSLHLPRYAGLVTVLPARNMQFTMYSVAVSLNHQVSGNEIISQADARPLCRRRDCTITNRWQEIPVNDQPMHIMHHGDSFQVMVYTNDDMETRHKKRRCHSTEEQPSSSTGTSDVAMTSFMYAPPASSAASSSNQPPPSETGTSDCDCNYTHDDDIHGHRTILHVFQLDGPSHVIALQGFQGIHPSQSVAQAIGVPLTQLEILHQVPIRPVDIPRGQVAVIAQRSGDIEYNHNERLILVDILYHHHSTTHGHLTRPTLVRLVQTAPEFVLRDGLLHIAAVLQYCQFQPNDCILQLDGHLWPVADLAPRRVYHGSYAVVDVPPPQRHDADTRIAAQILHSDSMSHDDAIQEQRAMSDDDATVLLQSPAMSDAHQAVFVSAPAGHDMSTTPDIRTPQVTTHAQGPLNKCAVTGGVNSATDESTTQSAGQGEVPLSNQAVLNPLPAGQSKISHFFASKPKVHGKVTHGKPSTGQTTIHQFFRRQHTPRVPSSVDCDTIPQSAQETEILSISHLSATPHQARCDTSQVVDPPRFEVAIPSIQQPMLPPEQGHHLWRLDIQRYFEDYAIMAQFPIGPVLYVQVWFIHHGRYRTCPAPKIVRLEDEPEHWYETFIEAWREQVQADAPVRVEVVAPLPAYSFHEHAPVHVLLEQMGHQDVIALVFTAAFHGGHRMGLFQVAEAMPRRISTRRLIQHHQFQQFCDFRPCRMYSGRFQFDMDMEEDAPTGISLLLDVGPIPAASASSAEAVQTTGDTDDHGFMQTTPTRWHHSKATSPSGPKAPVYKAAPATLTRSQPARPTVPAQADAPMVHLSVSNLHEFQATLRWVVQEHQNRVGTSEGLALATWFADAHTLPRSDHSRLVQLTHEPDSWLQDIARRWHDFLRPAINLEFHLVHPAPIGGDPQVVGHVILLQAHAATQRVSLITVTDWNDDPWHPSHVCTFLSSLTTQEEILQEAMIDDQCPPVKPDAHCIVQHGALALTPGLQFPVRHGFGFEVAAAIDDDCPAHDPRDSVALIQLSFQKIQRTIAHLQDSIETASRQGSDRSISPELREPSPPLLARDTQWNDGDFDLVTRRLQPLWEHAAHQIAPSNERAATVIVWYVDHVRLPQCFHPRPVLLFQHRQEWEPLIIHAWRDFVRRDIPVHMHVVFPDPEDLDPQVMAHIIVTQQAIPQFKSILISSYDSATPGLVRLHATMAPDPLPRDTLYALAYLERDCAMTHITCAAWHGDQELHPMEAFPLENGMSFIIALHRHFLPLPEGPDPWQATASRPTGPPVQISLQASVAPSPSPKIELNDALPQLLWFECEAWYYEMTQANPIVLHPLPEGLTVQPVSYWALLHVPPSQPDPTALPSYRLYVDGSASSTHAGWGLILTQVTGPAEVFVGCTHGKVCLEPENPHWVGATTVDNISAELTAMVVAQSVVLRWPHSAAFTICPDLSLSRMLAQATSVCRSNPALAQLCKALGLWTAKQADIEEVRGHTQHPWNELADSVAKWAISHDALCSHADMSPLHRLAHCPHDISWAWMQTTHESMAACFPPLVEQQILQITPSDIQLDVVPTERVRPDLEATAEATLRM